MTQFNLKFTYFRNKFQLSENLIQRELKNLIQRFLPHIGHVLHIFLILELQ